MHIVGVCLELEKTAVSFQLKYLGNPENSCQCIFSVCM
uniref:Uncharacterized protein n=1 Tax=Anguilla anguilla TaxID=7936 RepID=A0A0E9TRG5_ANGAN